MNKLTELEWKELQDQTKEKDKYNDLLGVNIFVAVLNIRDIKESYPEVMF